MTDIAARIPAAASSFFQSFIPPPEDYLSCYKTHGALQGKTGLLSSIRGVPSVAWDYLSTSKSTAVGKEKSSGQVESSGVARSSKASTKSPEGFLEAVAADPWVHALICGPSNVGSFARKSWEDLKNTASAASTASPASPNTDVKGWMKEVSSHWFNEASEIAKGVATTSRTSVNSIWDALSGKETKAGEDFTAASLLGRAQGLVQGALILSAESDSRFDGLKSECRKAALDSLRYHSDKSPASKARLKSVDSVLATYPLPPV